MDKKEALNRILKEEDDASQAYEKAFAEAQHASSTAQKELQKILSKAEADARLEADQLWKNYQDSLNQPGANAQQQSSPRAGLDLSDSNLKETLRQLFNEVIKG
jgi:vacuolar-type H+-ATPase subunit H